MAVALLATEEEEAVGAVLCNSGCGSSARNVPSTDCAPKYRVGAANSEHDIKKSLYSENVKFSNISGQDCRWPYFCLRSLMNPGCNLAGPPRTKSGMMESIMRFLEQVCVARA